MTETQNSQDKLRDLPDDFTAISIRSERLILRAIKPEDDGAIFDNFTTEITRYMYPSPAPEIDVTRAFIAESIKGLKEKNNLQLVITLPDEEGNPGEFIGCCGLHKLEDPEPELGIWTKKAAHGKGYGREAITAIVNWAKENTDYNTLLYPVDKENIPSRKIPESLGGKVGREFTAKGMAGNKLDLVEYRVALR